MSRRVVELAAIAAVVAAAALVVQPVGCNQTAHMALAKALSDGTPRIDRYEAETCDDAYIGGHFYAAKAPGLALVLAPWYSALEATRVVSRNPALADGWPDAMVEMPRSAVWQAGLVGTVFPFGVLLLLLRWAGDRLVPDHGGSAALIAGTSTLLLPFATVLFVHVLSAALAFAAFCVLLRDRLSTSSTLLVAAGGLLAGLAVVVEFPLAIAAVVLGGYALSRLRNVRRGAAYVVGVALGLSPLLVFNAWALGSPKKVTYSNAVITPGTSGHDVTGANDRGLFGIEGPELRSGIELLLSAKGLLVLSPVLAAAAVGIVLLYRAGHRAEALAAGAIAVAFLVYNSGYYLPFGGWVPGPRFLVPAIPFLALGIAPALRVAPLTTLLLGGVSTFWMMSATLGEPLLEDDRVRSWLERLGHGDLTQTIPSLLWSGHGWTTASPVIALLLLAIGSAVWLSWRSPLSQRDVRLAAAGLAAWIVLASAAPDLLRIDRSQGQWTGLAAVCVLVLVLGVSAWRAGSDGALWTLVLIPLAALVVPGAADHSRWALLLGVAVLGLLLCALSLERARARPRERAS